MRQLISIPAVLLVLSSIACTRQPAPEPEPISPFRVTASIQELMDSVIDPAADDIWDSVSTTTTRRGVEEHRPRTPEDWNGVRRRVVTLVEGTNLLVMAGRHVSKAYVAPDGPGVLDSTAVQTRIDATPAAFVVLAHNLQDAGLHALQAVDAKDAQALLVAGGQIDAACEQCHQTYWYPDQKIPVPPQTQRRTS